MLTFYLESALFFALNSTTRHAIGKRTCGLAFSARDRCLYFYYKHWALTNVLAFGICVTAIAEVRIQSFKTSGVLLVGLFLYDIFWVFGTDVMLSVATGIDGPIKILFPQTFFGDHAKLSLLGLGDMVIPGFFISQTLVFSELYAKKGTLYYRVAMLAYFCSLVNTMVVMVVFKHGQPALLYIVPWLLISTLLAAVVNGDLGKLFSFDMDQVTNDVIEATAADKQNGKEEEAVVVDHFSPGGFASATCLGWIPTSSSTTSQCPPRMLVAKKKTPSKATPENAARPPPTRQEEQNVSHHRRLQSRKRTNRSVPPFGYTGRCVVCVCFLIYRCAKIKHKTIQVSIEKRFLFENAIITLSRKQENLKNHLFLFYPFPQQFELVSFPSSF